MSSPGIPKEQRTAYQRWELDSFDAPKEIESAVILPTAAQLERLHQQAHEEGYAAGHREGSARAAAETLRLQQILAALAEESRQFDQRVADELLGLSLRIAKQVLQQALKLRPEVIVPLVNEVLGQLPLARQRACLILHPEDAALVRLALGERLGQSGWDIIENAEISRGGCRLEAAECEIDASLERRWQRVTAAVGAEHAWIE
ncbi:MAG TPA: flagellar assembly protein FliH [Burkholderiales bacterium]|nr:flagellar assembly protein FliH [Burkholderiales bacterium]